MHRYSIDLQIQCNYLFSYNSYDPVKMEMRENPAYGSKPPLKEVAPTPRNSEGVYDYVQTWTNDSAFCGCSLHVAGFSLAWPYARIEPYARVWPCQAKQGYDQMELPRRWQCTCACGHHLHICQPSRVFLGSRTRAPQSLYQILTKFEISRFLRQFFF